ncbi:hypothetical protein J2Y48_004238 [Mycoplana sp. BE70]|uniref:DUF982 domain-containing protein n=1 Tax=Mycoplana sp. BE70 TaxID=2817775 RepID=UPI00285AC0EC|nr:hypothetical protein [Mycoplana sp. BE70]
MDPRYWTKSVGLELGGLAQVEIVRSTHQAATVLSHWPPGKQGEAYIEAKRVCRAVLKDDAPSQIARDVFIRAAEVAGILIRKK